MFDSQWLTRVQCRQLSFHPRFSSWRLVSRSIALYGAVLVVGTGFFFFLHYVGNQIPYDLALQRFSTDYAINLPQTRAQYPLKDRHNIADPWQYCELSVAVIGGGVRDESYNAFVDAFMPKAIRPGTPCGAFSGVVAGSTTGNGPLKLRYWWGTKALYAIALRYLTVFRYHQLIEIATYGSYLLLAVVMLLNGWRLFLIGSPVLIFGLFIPTIGFFTDASNGVAYLWALLSVATLGFLVWRDVSNHMVQVFCFIAGMISSYLWIFDGSNFLAIPLIGLIVWFGYQQLEPRDKARRVVTYIVTYIVGFLSCYSLGQVTKEVVNEYATVTESGYIVLNQLLNAVIDILKRQAYWANLGALMNDGFSCDICGNEVWQKLPLLRHISVFGVLSPMTAAANNAMLVFTVLAFLVAAPLTGLNFMRGRRDVMWSFLFLVGIMLIICLKFFIPDHVPFRTVRFVSLLLALCWSCLIMVLIHSNRRLVLSVGGGFILAWLITIGWWSANALSIDMLTKGAEMVAHSDFDVYMSEDRLLYVKDDCDDTDVKHRFFLHVILVDVNDLPEDRQKYGFYASSFFFWQWKLPLLSDRRLPFLTRCAASVDLPDYDISLIRTGQLGSEGQIWNRTFNLDAIEAMNDLADLQRDDYKPAIQSDFDVYLDGNRLVYAKSPCNDAEHEALFFLHVQPADANHLPQERIESGFDNLDFTLRDYGLQNETGCVGAIDLPTYPIAKITTGQYEEGERIWGGTIHVPVLHMRDNLREIQSRDVMPVIQSDFDVYLDGDKLTYVKSLCDETDRDARFFLHVKPADAKDLPQDRRESGFDNLDFILGQNGGRIGDECLAEIQLPSYEISEITTGLLDEKGERIWDDKISVGD